MAELSYPELEYFFTGYFHQYWSELYDWKGRTPFYEGIVRFFKQDNSKEVVEQVTRELEQLINQHLNEDDLYDMVVWRLGANIRAAGFGMTYQEWLQSVLKVLQEEDTDFSRLNSVTRKRKSF